MKIAILTEGESEYASLPLLYSQLKERTGASILNPIRIAVQPDGPPEKIALQCEKAFKICAARGVALAVVVLDREQKSQAPGTIATLILDAINRRVTPSFGVRVVLKDRAFENWVIADPEALRSQPARYTVTPSLERAVAPDRADRSDALVLLKKATQGSAYDKVADAKRILARADVGRAAANSRSFRHLLHVIGDPSYASQCLTPVAP